MKLKVHISIHLAYIICITTQELQKDSYHCYTYPHTIVMSMRQNYEKCKIVMFAYGYANNKDERLIS